MEKEELLLIHGTEYKEMTKEILYAAGLEAQIGAREKKIGIKPNLVAPSEAFLGATTHPEIVAGIIEYLQEAGFQNISIDLIASLYSTQLVSQGQRNLLDQNRKYLIHHQYCHGRSDAWANQK